MAVASGPPMKIGSMRCAPSSSRSSTMGVLLGQLDPDADDLHLDHPRTIAPPSPGLGPIASGLDAATAAGDQPPRCSRSAWRSMAARSRPPRPASSSSRSVAWARDAGLRCLSSGMTSCSKTPGLALGGHLVHAQVAGLDAVAHERGGQRATITASSS